MQVKEIKSEGLSRELEVTVPANDIKKLIDARLIEVGKTEKIFKNPDNKMTQDYITGRFG